jgi:hypothetical protein
MLAGSEECARSPYINMRSSSPTPVEPFCARRPWMVRVPRGRVRIAPLRALTAKSAANCMPGSSAACCNDERPAPAPSWIAASRRRARDARTLTRRLEMDPEIFSIVDARSDKVPRAPPNRGKSGTENRKPESSSPETAARRRRRADRGSCRWPRVSTRIASRTAQCGDRL